MRSYRPISCIVALFLVSCATTPPAYQRVDPPSGGLADVDVPRDIFGDAARTKRFVIFSKSISDKLTSYAAEESNGQDASKQIKNLICEGSKGKVRPVFNVKVIAPKAPKGVPLEQVTESRKKFFEYAQYFLKTRFFASMIDRDLINPRPPKVRLNADYQNILSEDALSAEPKIKDKRYSIPIQLDTKRQALEDFYLNLPYVPKFTETRWIERWNEPNENIDQQFFGVLVGEKSTLLVPKAANFIEVGWNYEGDQIEPKAFYGAIAEFSNTLRQTKSGLIGQPRNEDYFRKRVHVVASEYAWDFPQIGKAHPVQAAFAHDLEELVKRYAFVFSRESVEKLFGYTDPTVQQHFGPDFYTGKFNQTTAINDRQYIWEMFLWRATSLKEAPQPDGSVIYMVTLDMKPFCELGVAVTDLTSQ